MHDDTEMTPPVTKSLRAGENDAGAVFDEAAAQYALVDELRDRPRNVFRPTQDTARCYRCERELPVDAFPKDRSKASGRKSICRECDNVKSKRYYAEHRQAVRARIAAQKARDGEPKE